MDDGQPAGGTWQDSAFEGLAGGPEPSSRTNETGERTCEEFATVPGTAERGSAENHIEPQTGAEKTFGILRPAAGAHGLGPMGCEVILLVEDDDLIRMLARQILEGCGYVVHEARNGRHGLAQCQAHEGPIDLLLTDVMMPELDGRELAEAALKLRPGMKVLLMSGQSQDDLFTDGDQSGINFLQKPFLLADLARRVRDSLDSGAKAAGQA
jgi:two-component system cell cycle sensor histidine kinase/response regulator CckA